MSSIIAHIKLTRPANIVTAIADILAGAAISGAVYLLLQDADQDIIKSIAWLVLSTIGLYGGGVAFNDVFDAELDSVERPERPIPSGQASVKSAGMMAFLLLLVGVFAAWQVSAFSAGIALSVALLAVLYDAWGKHQNVFGPINMGLCRAGNLLLGMSLMDGAVQNYWYIGLIPLLYVAAITMVSRGEVHGQNILALKSGLVIYAVIVGFIFLLAYSNIENWWESLPFLALLSYFIFPPLVKALKYKEPSLIGKSVKAAVLALIIVNAAIAVAFAGWIVGLVILLLLPLSLQLAKGFAVT
ncbi:UbiA-like protein EboC [Cyclobacterium marinum]|uniref:UbiA prenyltransferase n=1 Tax=Cyclobacterium marinum (strain ATCC 25205 / DSM 745 / LMG 13164 / NCIMB 1802) TaxID=880070 RepID=G0J105_CYCMS|nr:UbiA-like protein EboC [Cyclobacterium marinum]AEL25131.1 UbiA prenyltransferase [Cyclobacterium marinum DSM 745]MBI0401400.1 UbiA-like protein EboC [Cyclobacterium marinum]MBR9774470.1 UbiA-like protein EboC [Cytophagales bacterium]|tara:strand:- start:124240 stop:125139 length:900 start_codon:yes stop_codon:yes gene_type:complete